MTCNAALLPTVSLTLPMPLSELFANATRFGQNHWWSGFPNWEDLDLDSGQVEVNELEDDGGLISHHVSRKMVLDAFSKIDGDVLGRIISKDFDNEDLDVLLQMAVFGKTVYS